MNTESSMQLKPPFLITSRLLPGLQIGGATIQLELAGETRDGRTRYRWTIDLPDGKEYSGNDLKSGVGGGSLQSGFESLLSFLSACGESYSYRGAKGENSDLFPEPVAQWAAENTDELSMLECELQEQKDLITP